MDVYLLVDAYFVKGGSATAFVTITFNYNVLCETAKLRRIR